MVWYEWYGPWYGIVLIWRGGGESDEKGMEGRGVMEGRRRGMGVRQREGGKAVMWGGKEGKVVVCGCLLFMGRGLLSAVCACHSLVGGHHVQGRSSFVCKGSLSWVGEGVALSIALLCW